MKTQTPFLDFISDKLRLYCVLSTNITMWPATPAGIRTGFPDYLTDVITTELRVHITKMIHVVRNLKNKTFFRGINPKLPQNHVSFHEPFAKNCEKRRKCCIRHFVLLPQCFLPFPEQFSNFQLPYKILSFDTLMSAWIAKCLTLYQTTNF